MLPGRIVEEIVDRKRQVALLRVDALVRGDQGGDFAEGFAEIGRVDVEEEAFPSEEALEIGRASCRERVS
jgi:hypothetical protein